MKPFRQLLIVIGVFGGIGSASAQPEDAATALARGKASLKAGRVHEACDAFAASEKLAAAVDTELALASCYEQDGKLVAAARVYRTAADKDPNAKRKQTSADKATKLEARAPKLRFAISQRPDGLVIKVDGVDVPSTGDVRVDLGPHEVIATAPGFEGHASPAPDREGAVLDVILRMEATKVEVPTPPPTPTPTPPPTPAPEPTPAPAPAAVAPMPPPMDYQPAPSHRKRNGAIIGGVGVAALIGAAVFYELGTSKFDDEHKLCPGYLCASDADTAKANSLRDDGRSMRGVAIGVGIGGVVLVGVGAFLFVSSHHESSPVSFQLDRHGGGVTYALGF